MRTTAEAGRCLPALLTRQRELHAELRGIEHWRRLVAARLDLAIAAVTDIDEPPAGALPRPVLAAGGLRQLVGLPTAVDARADASALVPLRSTLDGLDGRLESLRRQYREATRELLEALEAAGGVDAADAMIAVRYRPWRRPGRDTLPGRSRNRARRVVAPPGITAEEAG